MTTLVKVGDRLENSDPRTPKTVIVIAVTNDPDNPGAADKTFAHYYSGKRRVKIRADRIVERGEPHHNHFWIRIPAETAV